MYTKKFNGKEYKIVRVTDEEIDAILRDCLEIENNIKFVVDIYKLVTNRAGYDFGKIKYSGFPITTKAMNIKLFERMIFLDKAIDPNGFHGGTWVNRGFSGDGDEFLSYGEVAIEDGIVKDYK